MNKVEIQSQSNGALTFAAFLIIISVAMYAADIITPILLALFISVVLAQQLLARKKESVIRMGNIYCTGGLTFNIFGNG